MKQRRIIWFLAALLIAALVGGCSGGNEKVGVLDVAKVMSDSPKVQQFQTQLNAKGKEMTDQLEKDKASLSPEEFRKKQEASYGEFVKVKQDLENQIDASIKEALTGIAKEKGLGVVLYKTGVAQGGIDVTEDVIKKLQ